MYESRYKCIILIYANFIFTVSLCGKADVHTTADRVIVQSDLTFRNSDALAHFEIHCFKTL